MWIEAPAFSSYLNSLDVSGFWFSQIQNQRLWNTGILGHRDAGSASGSVSSITVHHHQSASTKHLWHIHFEKHDTQGDRRDVWEQKHTWQQHPSLRLQPAVYVHRSYWVRPAPETGLSRFSLEHLLRRCSKPCSVHIATKGLSKGNSSAAQAALLWCKTRQSKRSLVLSALG